MIEKIKEIIRGNKKLLFYFLVLVIGLLFLLISSGLSGGESSGGGMSESDYKEKLEDEIENLCSSVRGVGKCKVFITLKRGVQNTYKGSNLIESRPPEVLGVTVVCRGADSDAVREELSEMLSALFDIGYNRIAILKLNS